MANAISKALLLSKASISNCMERVWRIGGECVAQARFRRRYQPAIKPELQA